MDFVLTTILSCILAYRYTAFFAFIFIGSFLIPLPNNLILLATGAFASQGYLNLYLAVALALTTNIGADILGYFLARKYGVIILKKLHVSERNIEKVGEKVRDYASATIFVTRIAGPFGATVNFVSGLLKVPFRKFIIFNLLGNFVDIVFYMVAGYLLGNYWEIYSDEIVFAVAVVGFLIIVGFVVIKSKSFGNRFSANSPGLDK